jgi:hypothetical protein
MLTARGKSASASLTLSGTSGVGGTPTSNLTLSPGKFTQNDNGIKIYSYLYPKPVYSTQTFTVTNSGTSALEQLAIGCDGPGSGANCISPFGLLHDTCTNTSLAANGGSCTFELEVSLFGPCKEHQSFITPLAVTGAGVTYITLFATAGC